MRRRFPTLTAGSALALLAVTAPVGFAVSHLLHDADSHPKSARKHRGQLIRVTGEVGRPLAPGTARHLNLRLSNRSPHHQVVLRLTVSVTLDAAHRRAGCSRARNFRVLPMRRGEYPISLPAGRAGSLHSLGVRRVPRLRMLNLRTNQDACKGAKLRLHYRARIRRAPARHAP
jgi:hypothetical protein